MPDVSTPTAEPRAPDSRFGPGRRLDASMRSRAESSYGTALGDVTVHTGPEADAFARGHGGVAATVGSRIAVAAGYYRPGTLLSDAVMAHELAHVVQQGGAAVAPVAAIGDGPVPDEHGAVHEEHGADRAAATLLLGGHAASHQALLDDVLGPGDATPARTAGRPRVQSCLCPADPAGASDVTVDTDVSAQTDSLMDELEGLETPYEAITYRDDLRTMNVQSAQLAGMSGNTTPNIPAEYKAAKAAEAAEDAAAVEGTTVAGIEAKAASFVQAFQEHAVNVAYQLLASNEELVEGEAKRYAGSPDSGGIAEMLVAAAPYLAKLQQAKADREYAAGRTQSFGGGRGVVATIKPPDAKEKQAAADAVDDEVRKALVARFPVLADPDMHMWDLIETPAVLQGRISWVTDQRIEDIQQTRGELKADNSLVWQFDNAIAAARISLNIIEGSIFDEIIKRTIAKREADEFFTNLLVGALAIGLGLLSFGGGAVAVFAAAGGAVLSAGTAYSHVLKYLQESAAAGSALDRARAVSSQEPSLFWLAVDLVGAAFDLGMAVKAFNALKTTAKAVQAGTKTVADLKTEAIAFAKTEPTLAANAEKVGEVAEQSVKKELSREDVISAAEKADSAGVAAVKAIATDDASVSGLLRVEGSVRAKLLAAFGKKPNILIRLGTLIDEVPDIANLLKLLSENLPANQFEAVISKYMLTRSKQAPYILRAMSQVGLTADDVKTIGTALGGSKSVREIGRRFATAAIERVAERLPSGAAGLKKFRQIAPGLHPNQSGTIFERWATKNVYNTAKAERFQAETADLVKQYSADAPKFKDSKLASDHTLHPGNGEATIVDYKADIDPHKFGQDRLDQLDDYAELLRIKAKAPNGDIFTKVEYLFANQAAAEKNAPTVLNKLGDKASVYFLDDAGNKVKYVGKGP